jgi:hypothetical protein
VTQSAPSESERFERGVVRLVSVFSSEACHPFSSVKESSMRAFQRANRFFWTKRSVVTTNGGAGTTG